ncbi:MAG: DUF2892 domain-containing protein [Desulfosporosinus sp.]|nr:DUF2892 domain-containing protein [Desulfosporosinus sp.]
MKCNVGGTERFIRLVVGAIILFLGLYFRSWWGIIGLLPLITGALRYCPISALLDISTCKVDNGG